ncbi:endolytic transglycosylase MltG [Rhodobacteraceae bacterium NNCM2]|nr:endolytic transglycosylase MltG [Coraliihabitans acroporae]
MRHIAANLLSIMIVAGLGLTGLIVYAKETFVAPGPLAEEVVVSLPKGANLRTTSELLASSGAISNQTLFRLGTRYEGREQAIKFGEYRIPAHASMEEILDLIVSGKTEQYRVTVPEGLTSFEIVALLNEQELLTGELDEVPPEGHIAPDTHFVARNQPRADVLKLMVAAQEKILAEAWENRQPDLPLESPEEMLTLASIVQSEAGADELDKVASVFINRLRKGQRLEADATIRYGLTMGKEKIRRGLKRSELNKKTPYNTYQIVGLPPTPISNPGKAAIEAVANPAETDFFFFVADGSGGHAFSKTLAEHQVNVAKWRAIERARQAGE